MGTSTYHADAELARRLQAQEFGVEDTTAPRSMSPRRSGGRRSRGEQQRPTPRRKGGWRSWSWYSRETTDASGSRDDEQWRREDSTGASSSGSKDRRHDARREDSRGGREDTEHWSRREDTTGASSSGWEDPQRRDVRQEERTPPHHTVVGQWPIQDGRKAGQQPEGELLAHWDHDMGHRHREDSPARQTQGPQQPEQTEVRKEPNRKQQKQAPKPEKPPERDQRGGLFGKLSWSSWTHMCTSGCSATDAEEFDVVRVQAIRNQVAEDVEDDHEPPRARHIAEDESTGLSSEGHQPQQSGAHATQQPTSGPGPMPVPATINSAKAVALGAIAGGVTRGAAHLTPVLAGAAVGHVPGTFLGIMHSAQAHRDAAAAARYVERFIEAAHGVTQRCCHLCGLYFKTSKPEEHPWAYLCAECRWHTWCVTRVQARFRGSKVRKNCRWQNLCATRLQARYRGRKVRSEVARLRATNFQPQEGRDMRTLLV
mmetsp:Transcript_24080/g.44203  ORF Transcript_24080/g.44203 Transcript_24080/m.44203 type:complete len:484 (+) Transcript_24080:73-1524(+)